MRKIAASMLRKNRNNCLISKNKLKKQTTGELTAHQKSHVAPPQG